MVTRMDTRRTAVLVLMFVNVAWLKVALAGDPAGLASPVFTIVGANQVVLRRAASDQAQAVYALAISPATGVELHAWLPVVLATVRDGSVQTAAEGAVTPLLVPGDSAHPALLQLTVEFAKLSGPGTYDVTIGFFALPAPPAAGSASSAAGGASAAPTPGGDSSTGRAPVAPKPGSGTSARADAATAPTAAPETSRVVVKLVLPAAQLRAPSTVRIDRFLPLYGAPVDTPGVITLYETGKDAPIDVSIRRDGELTSSDHPIGAEIELSDGSVGGPKLAPIPAGGPSPVAIRVTGEVPVGITHGNLLISAPELPTAVSVPIEIRTHRSTWWVPLLFLLGAALGLVWRYVSQQRKQQLEKQARVQDLLDRIAEFERGYPTTWYIDLTKLMTERDALTRRSDPPDAAITDAEQTLTSAIGVRATKRGELLSHLAEARDATLRALLLPAGLDVTALARGFQAAHDEAVADKLARAIALGNNATQQLSVLVAAAQAWGRGFRATIEPVKDGVKGCPKEARGPVNAAIAKAIESASKLDTVSQADVVASDAPPVGPRLDTLQTARLDADSVARVLVEGLQAASVAITGVGVIEPNVRQRIRNAITVREVPDRPEQTIAAAVDACATLETEAGVVLDLLYPAGRPPEVKKLFDAGDYPAALSWRSSGKDKTPGEPASFHSELLESVELDGLAVKVGLGLRRTSREPEAPTAGPTLERYVPGDSAPRRTTAAIRRELAWWMRVGWVISALVASIAVWAIYGDSFVGTRVELFGLFTTGFAIDLATGSKLEELIGKIKIPGVG